MNNIDQAALATANWWADQVFGGTVASNGDDLSTMLSVLAGAQGRLPEPSKRNEFVLRLATRVKKELERESTYDPSCMLSTDYGPEGFLRTLATDLRIQSFPWKTMTHTYVDHFVTALGYGAGSQLSWTADDYVRPKCGLGAYTDDADFHRLPFKCSAPRYHPINEHVFDDPDPLCQAPHPYEDGKPCLHPGRDEYHALDSAFPSRFAHEFQA